MRHTFRWLGPIACCLLLDCRVAAGQQHTSTTPDSTSRTVAGPPPGQTQERQTTSAGDAHCSTCNEPATTITLNFDCRCFENADALNKLRRGDVYKVHITHINTLLYKIAIGVKDTSKTTALNFPTFSSVGLSDLATLASDLTPVTVAATMKTIAVNLMPEERSRLTPAERKQQKLKAKKQQELQAKQEQTRQLIQNYTDKLKGQATELITLNRRIDDLFFKYNKRLTYVRLEYEYIPSGSRPLVTEVDIGNVFTELDGIRKELTDLEDRAKGDNDNYIQDTEDYQKIIADDSGLKAGDANAKGAYKKLTDGIAKVALSVSADNVQKYLKTLSDAANNQKMEFWSLPIQFSQQQSLLRIIITPRGTDNALQEYRTQLVYPMDKSGFWGVSSGFFVSRLYSEAYSTQAVQAAGSSTVNYALVQEDPGKFEFGASAMVRYGWEIKNHNTFGWQVGFGPALSVSTKVRPRLMLGTGPVIGKNHKFLADVGVALGYVDQLSAAYSNYSPSKTYATRPDNVTVSTLRANVYLGIHYLFIK